MSNIEIKATLKSMTIQDDCKMVFVLSPEYAYEIPKLTKLSKKKVLLNIFDEQMSIDDVEEEDTDTITLDEALEEEDAEESEDDTEAADDVEEEDECLPFGLEDGEE